MERHLRRFRGGAAEEPERHEHRERRRLAERLRGALEHRPEVERAGLLDEDEEREREGRVAEGVHDERLLAGGDGLVPVVPEVDQQVGREPDQAPAGQEQDQVSGLDEEQHREEEERLVGVVAPLLGVRVHVADGVGEDQEADPGDDEHHEDGQRVHRDREAGPEAVLGEAVRSSRDPGVERRALLGPLLRVLAEQEREDDDGADERDECRERGDPACEAAGDPVAAEREEDDRGGRREERDPGGDGHAFTCVGRSTLAASTIPTARPTAVSASDPDGSSAGS